MGLVFRAFIFFNRRGGYIEIYIGLKFRWVDRWGKFLDLAVVYGDDILYLGWVA